MRLLANAAPNAAEIASGESVKYDELRHGWLVDDVLYLDYSRTYALDPIPAYTAALEAMYDEVARACPLAPFDNRYTLTARAGYPGPFQDYAIAFGTWMDGCNLHARGIMAEVFAEAINAPTIPELIAMMPTIEWPTHA